MTKILLSGCNGHMGRVISQIVSEQDDCRIVAGIDLHGVQNQEYPVYTSVEDVTEEADVLVDFSHPSTLPSLLEYGLKKKLPVVLCTTGYSHDQVKRLKDASNEFPVFYSGNMSLGINLLMALSKKAAQVLGTQFDVEIIEQHHNQKLDAPSGTALMLADAVASGRNDSITYTYDRHSQRKKRETNEIGMHSVRGGTIVGEHSVIFAGPQEVITLSHSAQSREVFANGAIHAAMFLTNQPAGLYDMFDLLK